MHFFQKAFFLLLARSPIINFEFVRAVTTVMAHAQYT